MAHIDVDAPGIRQKPPVAWRLIMPTMMEIKDTAASGMKNVIPDALRHPGRRMVRPILIDQETIFRFDSKNTIQHVSQLFIQGFCVVLVAKPMVVPPCVESRSVRT